MDPALAQAIGTIAGAIAMAIVAIVSYYFPRGRDRFDDEERPRRKKRRRVDADELDGDES